MVTLGAGIAHPNDLRVDAQWNKAAGEPLLTNGLAAVSLEPGTVRQGAERFDQRAGKEASGAGLSKNVTDVGEEQLMVDS